MDFVEWQWLWLSKVLPSPCGHHGSKTVSQTIPHEDSMVTHIQQRFPPLAFTHPYFPWLPESFHNIMNCEWWKTIIFCYQLNKSSSDLTNEFFIASLESVPTFMEMGFVHACCICSSADERGCWLISLFFFMSLSQVAVHSLVLDLGTEEMRLISMWRFRIISSMFIHTVCLYYP